MIWHVIWIYAFTACLQIAFWLKQKMFWMQNFSVSDFVFSLLLTSFLKVSLVFLILLGACRSGCSSQKINHALQTILSHLLLPGMEPCCFITLAKWSKRSSVYLHNLCFPVTAFSFLSRSFKELFPHFFFLLFIRESMANIKIICCKILPWEVLLYQGMRMVQCHPQRCCSHCSERGCIPSFRHCKIHCMSFKISAAMPLKICKVQCLGKQLFRTTGNFHAVEGCGKRTENRRRL